MRLRFEKKFAAPADREGSVTIYEPDCIVDEIDLLVGCYAIACGCAHALGEVDAGTQHDVALVAKIVTDIRAAANVHPTFADVITALQKLAEQQKPEPI